MEEGPEPQEWVERSVEHHHHHAEHDEASEAAKRATMLSAITAAVLAVCAALGSLLSGHEANQAILHQTKATDQWAYFQSKSTKGHIYEMGREVVRSLAEAQGLSGEKTKSTLERFDQQVQRYNAEKAEVEADARHLEEESQHEFAKHHAFALGIAAFQVGIVLSSISIMIRYRFLWVLSLVSGAIGVVFLCRGLIM